VRIVIVGGGLVGSTLADRLARDGNDVSLVEQQSKRSHDLSDQLDVQVTSGNGATAPVLRRAGAENADLLVATTDSDEVNMAVGMIATALFQVPRVLVRLRDPAHREGFELLAKAATKSTAVRVNPESVAVDRISSLLQVPGAVDVVPFLNDRVVLAGFRMTASSDLTGLSLAHMKLLFPATPTLVTAIHRGDAWIVPHGDEEIQAGDLVYFSIAREEVADVTALVGDAEPGLRRVMIAGAGRVGIELARRLEKTDTRVILIEDDAACARRAEEQLGETLVVHGSVTERSLLEEEDIERVSTFVALTGDQEVNLVSSLLAKRLGARRAIALVDNPALADLIGDVGIDAVISPRLLAVGLMLQHIRRGRVRGAVALLEEGVEVMEVEAEAGSRLVAADIADIGLPRGIVVAALLRGDRLLVPSGRDRIAPGDEVLLVSAAASARKLDAFLTRA